MAAPVALVLDAAALLMGLSDDGFGWAFQMPQIVLAGLSALAAGVTGVGLAIMRLLHQRGHDVLMWLALVIAGATGLAGVLMALLAMAASASI